MLTPAVLLYREDVKMGKHKGKNKDTSKPRGKKNRDVAADLTHDNDEALAKLTDDGAPEVEDATDAGDPADDTSADAGTDGLGFSDSDDSDSEVD
jgi:hypothetical protein